jgi:K+-sensing histidine kinase KdpD
MYDKLPEAKKRTLIESALTEAFRLDHFITNIIEMRKFQANEIVAHVEPCKLGLLIQDSLAYLGPLKAKGQLDIKQETPDDELVTDRTLGSRVIGLVLHNAFRHGIRKDSSTAPNIEITYGVKNHEGYVRIRDHGEGLELDKIKTLFERPAPLHHTDQNSAGAGVGIMISQYITRLLHGRIEFSNHPDGGATFTLYFKDERPA